MPPADPIGPFLALVAGALVAIAVLAALLGASLGRRARGAAAAAAALTVLGLLVVPESYRAVTALADQREANVTKANLEQRLDCLGRAGQPGALEFVEWLRAELPPDARYELAMNPSHAPCVSMGLLPRIAVAPDSDAGYIVFFGDVPPRWRAFFDSANGVERFDAERDHGYARLGS